MILLSSYLWINNSFWLRRGKKMILSGSYLRSNSIWVGFSR